MISRKRFKEALRHAKRRVQREFFFDEESYELSLKRARSTTCSCSSPYCCGNPRKVGRKTRQELKADIDFTEQMFDETLIAE